MNIYLRVFLWLAGICLGIYLFICGALYFNQEKLIFPGASFHFDRDYAYQFDSPFKEFNIKTKNRDTLSGVLFKADTNGKGIVFYLHGNAETIGSVYTIKELYNRLGYDLFIVDYPGFGKSTGHIHSQQQLLDGVQAAYDTVRNHYSEDKIIVIAHSVGTGMATWVASVNHPSKLILLAPYYSLTDMEQHNFPIIPTFILKYPLPSYQYLQQVKAPVTIFHGDQDEVIYYGSSLKLQKLLKKGDTLVTLKGQYHNDIEDNADYQATLKKLLN